MGVWKGSANGDLRYGLGSAAVVRWKSGWGCERLIKTACRAWGRLG